MRRATLVSLVGAVAFAACLPAPASGAERSCTALKNARFNDTTIESAGEVRPDPTWAFPPSLFDALASVHPTASPNVKTPFCRVVGTIEQEIEFELWLPDTWNGKYAQAGNGGYMGALNYPTMGGALEEGYATAATDLGHENKAAFDDSDWMIGHKQRLIDFGYRAHHLVNAVARQIVAAYYGTSPSYAYFVGCSAGGWQALTEIQKYPEDFNGVVAGAPAHNFVRIDLRSTVTAQMSLEHPEGNLTRAQTKLVAAAALQHCDAEDGLADGLLSDPLHCDFDPKQLQCKAGDAPESCLTPAQVERVNALYGPMHSKGGLELYPGPTVAAALPPSFPARGDAPALSAALRNALREFGYTKAPTLASFDPDKDIPAMDALMDPVMSSMDPDLSRFKARGGKVLVWQGWADPAVSPYNTVDYYDRVKTTTGGNMDDFYRIFFVPGMGHCGAGSTGPDKFDSLAALDSWVEKGVAPGRIEATQYKDGHVTRTRPLCVYPAVAKYTGTGSVNDARSFACVKPASSSKR
ncbi:MAG TPA: tannase/feruloyl esterase family alpha/beta hydrolase [Vicinamibacterales bacterium]|nr:tannase/feruloyl esterase family alpha/beta hydrolase [Vicinamibacterales bacterium]